MTTTSLTLGEETALKIKERPHWRTHIAPTTFEERFTSAQDVRDAAIESAVLLRGWDFPHFHRTDEDIGGNSRIPGGWESWFEFERPEAWRAMQSGQFIHYTTLREDSQALWRVSDNPALLIEGAICQITEVFEFATRFTERANYEPWVQVSIGLRGVGGRELVAEPIRELRSSYVARVSEISHERRLEVATLASRKREYILDALLDIFLHFGFEPPRDVLGGLHDRLVGQG